MFKEQANSERENVMQDPEIVQFLQQKALEKINSQSEVEKINKSRDAEEILAILKQSLNLEGDITDKEIIDGLTEIVVKKLGINGDTFTPAQTAEGVLRRFAAVKKTTGW